MVLTVNDLANELKKPVKCSICGERATQYCLCRKAYCSNSCQIDDWYDGIHRKLCGYIKPVSCNK